MIDFHYWPTPNGWKVSIMLEECGLDYRTRYVNIGRGEQHSRAFLALSPNGRMPVIVDDDPDPAYGPDPVSTFESGAILLYLAEKTGRFLPAGALARKETLEWLFWQVGGLGPMAGQLSHFVNYAPKDLDHAYAHRRYADEYHRLLGVLERRLENREFLVGDYSIADMAAWPWVLIAKPLGQALDADGDAFPNVARWRRAVKARPAVRAGVDLGKDRRRAAPPDEAERRVLFGRRAGRD